MESNSCSFFPSQQDEELLASLWDFGVDHVSHPGFSQIVEGINDNLGDGRKGKMPENSQEENNNNIIQVEPAKKQEKKIIHRDIERQRRREMATLCASLRAVLPPQYLEGKRSISDQIHGTTEYIRCLQNNIKQLGIKRDNIKRSSSKNEFLVLDSEIEGSSSKVNSPVVVTVEPCSVGVEILISGDLNTLPLSRILNLLLQEGLNIVCCSPSKFEGKLHYIIQSEVGDFPSINLETLQRKLKCAINTMTDHIKQ